MDEEDMIVDEWGGLPRAADGRRRLFEQVELTCEAMVGGERVETRLMVEEYAYRDPMVRAQVERDLREHLLRQIMERWKPEIRVHR